MDIQKDDVILTRAERVDDDGDVVIQHSDLRFVANVGNGSIIGHIPADPDRDVPVVANWRAGDVMLVRVSRVDGDGDPHYQRHDFGAVCIPRNSPGIIGRIPAPAQEPAEPETDPGALDWTRPMLVLLPDGRTERPTEISEPTRTGSRLISYPSAVSGRYFRPDGSYAGGDRPDRIIYAPADDAPAAPAIDWDRPLRVIDDGEEFPGVFVGLDRDGDHVVAWINNTIEWQYFNIDGSHSDGDPDYRVFNAPE